MKFLFVIILLCLAWAVQSQSDYISSLPLSVYESTTASPQNMDYDSVNKIFRAHSGWINDKLIYYYKFRMYTPMTYPQLIPMTADPANIKVPIGDMFVLVSSTVNPFQSVIASQLPIVSLVTSDGEKYSDFVELKWVVAPPGYVANTYKSLGDITAANRTVTASGIFVNLPIVPTGSSLQEVGSTGTAKAPISPLMVYYRGLQVQSFVLETTSMAFADFYNPRTRTGTSTAYSIPVVNYVASRSVSYIPLFHLNQYQRGVTVGVNNGGPSGAGQRNIITLDRDSAAYSPLWQIIWITKVPYDYSADKVSHAQFLTKANGFEQVTTPMLVNCPNIGPIGGSTLNMNKTSTFVAKKTVTKGMNIVIDGAKVMDGGKVVNLFNGNTKLASTTTGMMGEYSFTIAASQLGSTGDISLTVKDNADNSVLGTFELNVMASSGGSKGQGIAVFCFMVMVAILAMLWQ